MKRSRRRARGPGFWARKTGQKRRHREKVQASWLPRLRPGERLALNYAHDGALCSCPPTHDWKSWLPSMPVGRAKTYDRCLRCDARWTRQFPNPRPGWKGDWPTVERCFIWQPAILLPEGTP